MFDRVLNTPLQLQLHIVTGSQLGGEGGGLTCPFLKTEKSVLILGKKGPDGVYFGAKYSIQNLILRVSSRKSPKFSQRGLFSCVF